MPVSRQHAFLAYLFKENLERLLRSSGFAGLAEYAEATEIIDPNFTEFTPLESRADVMILHAKNPRFFVIGEVQTSINSKKAEDWPWYRMQASRRERCDGLVVVLATTRPVRIWAQNIAQQWEGSPMQLVVLGGDDLSEDWTTERIRTDLPGAVMTLILGAGDDAPSSFIRPLWREVLRQRTAGRIDQSTFDDYAQIILDSVPDTWRKQIMEHEMGLESWTQKQFDRKRAEGLQKGREEGRVTGIRRTLRLIIRSQAQTLCAESAARIDACHDVQQLERWVDWVLQQPRGVQLTLP